MRKIAIGIGFVGFFAFFNVFSSTIYCPSSFHGAAFTNASSSIETNTYDLDSYIVSCNYQNQASYDMKAASLFGENWHNQSLGSIVCTANDPHQCKMLVLFTVNQPKIL